MLKLLTAPPTNDRGPRYMERALAAIHQANRTGETLTLIYAAAAGRVGLYLQYADSIDEFICGPIAADYPNCTLTSAERFDEKLPGWTTSVTDLELVPELFPILRHAQFEDALNRNFADPINGILRAIKPDESVRCRIEIRIIPASKRRCTQARNAVRTLDREFFRVHHRVAEYFAEHITRPRGWLLAWIFGVIARRSPQPTHTALETSAGRLHDREENLQAAADKIGGHLFETQIRLVAHARPGADELAADRIQQMAGAFGAFTRSRLARFHLRRTPRGLRARRRVPLALMSHEELSTLFHPPCSTVAAERMQMMEFTELEPPPNFYSGTEAGAATIGRVLFRDDHRAIGIDEDARRRHIYIVGSTGAGKSTLLLNLIHQDMLAGRGATVIDVHGDLAEAAVQLVPKHRTNDVVVFDAASDQVTPFNPLACSDPRRIDQVTSGVVSAFKKLFDSWGPRLENLLRYTAFVAVEQQGTLLDMLRLLTEKSYRDGAIARVSDDVVRSFWMNEFAAWNSQYRTEAVSSVTNKLMPFLASRQLRAITSGQSAKPLDLRQVMDQKRILIVNLSRGRLGQDNSTLLGSLLLTSIEQAAMSRAELPEPDRRDHYLYLDEFQSLVTPSTAIVLSEARKYRLSLTLSHQLTRQLDPATYHGVIGNCGTMISFRVGLEDADLLAPAFSKYAGQLSPSDLCGLPNYTAYARLLIDGHPSGPFSLRTMPIDDVLFDDGRAEIVRRASSRRHSMLHPVGTTTVLRS